MAVDPTPAALAAFLTRVGAAVAEGRVEITAYARDGADDLGWVKFDILEQLRELMPDDFLRREESTARAGDLVWIFTPGLWDDSYLWVRLVERAGIVVVSFHHG